MDNELDYMAKKKKGKVQNNRPEVLPEGSVGGGSEEYLMTHEAKEAVREGLMLETDVPPNIQNMKFRR